MANLKDTIVLGNLTVTGTFTASDLFVTGGTLVGVGISSVTSCGWTDSGTASKLIPTMNFMAYWNGAYNSNNVSNLTYCSKGTIVGGSGTVTKIEKVTSLPSSPDANTVYFITG